MIPYILYASLILTACLIFYKLLLQMETFFRLNRFVLLSCMMLAFVLPVLHVPQQMSFRKAAAPARITSLKTAIDQEIISPAATTDVRGPVVENVKQEPAINTAQ